MLRKGGAYNDPPLLNITFDCFSKKRVAECIRKVGAKKKRPLLRHFMPLNASENHYLS